MVVVYKKVYNTQEGRKFKKGLIKEFNTREKYVRWLDTNNVIVKEVR